MTWAGRRCISTGMCMGASHTPTGGSMSAWMPGALLQVRLENVIARLKSAPESINPEKGVEVPDDED